MKKEIEDPENELGLQGKANFLGCFTIATLFATVLILLFWGH